MHRATPANSSFRAYSSGGARSVVDKVDDNPMMQEMKGNFMKGETRQKIESPQNYGFTSVVRDATKGKGGLIEECAEAFISFIGGNRSFPVAAIMDDRRFRLKELLKGDVAMFDWLQHQLHFNKDGIFMTGRTDKKLKLQLVPPPEEEKQQSGGGGGGSAASREAEVGALAASSGGGSGGGEQSSSGQWKSKGQKKRYDKEAKQYVEVTKDKTDVVHDKSINYKSEKHTFHPPDGAGAATRTGGPLVTILGDKLTTGFGEFIKQVKAASPIDPQHLTTKSYVDALFALVQSAISGITSSKGQPNGYATLDDTGKVPAAQLPSSYVVMQDRIAALEAEVAALKAVRNA